MTLPAGQGDPGGGGDMGRGVNVKGFLVLLFFLI